jgi:hypothetical protein
VRKKLNYLESFSSKIFSQIIIVNLKFVKFILISVNKKHKKKKRKKKEILTNKLFVLNYFIILIVIINHFL